MKYGSQSCGRRLLIRNPRSSRSGSLTGRRNCEQLQTRRPIEPDHKADARRRDRSKTGFMEDADAEAMVSLLAPDDGAVFAKGNAISSGTRHRVVGSMCLVACAFVGAAAALNSAIG